MSGGANRRGSDDLGLARTRRRGFPAGIKWKTVLGVEAKQKYVVCNADEGDSRHLPDRMIMEGDPLVLIEGMTIAASPWALPKVTFTYALNTPTRWSR